ncbi:hypothetical protein AB6A40_001872 [Gnathostoma spinigerum]|uniref:Uncharacterized protein n=1 Tax=Gnathostoma spinigerum TaxID=75299 RepID=A0ABD6EE87_9BILA
MLFKTVILMTAKKAKNKQYCDNYFFDILSSWLFILLFILHPAYFYSLDIPPLPDEPSEVLGEAEEEVEENESATPPGSSRIPKGSPAPDPYAEQGSTHVFIPILITFACFFPVLFCLRKV